MDNQLLNSIFEGRSGGEIIDEIVLLAGLVADDIDKELLRQVHQDLTDFFTGHHPDFQENTLPYHNLRHSQAVVLATARLFHGLSCNQISISGETMTKGLLAAYFHDSGLLLEQDDTASAGTDYMAGHEQRSSRFFNQYADLNGLPEHYKQDCAIIIGYTELSGDPSILPPHSDQIALAGQVVGSSDILAQMADRYYLESLPLLYHELEAGGVNKHTSALELMEHTANFYRDVVLKRLVITFCNTSRAMRNHFRERHQIDRNLYLENIDKNIIYLKKIISQCQGKECIEQFLKRVPPTT